MKKVRKSQWAISVWIAWAKRVIQQQELMCRQEIPIMKLPARIPRGHYVCRWGIAFRNDNSEHLPFVRTFDDLPVALWNLTSFTPASRIYVKISWASLLRLQGLLRYVSRDFLWIYSVIWYIHVGSFVIEAHAFQDFIVWLYVRKEKKIYF